MNSIPFRNPTQKGPSFLFIFSFIIFHLFSLSHSDPRISEAGLSCGISKPQKNATFIPIFVKEMEAISQLVTDHQFGTHFFNSSPPIYALAQCHQDLSHTDCLLCYAAGRTRLPRCLPSPSARIYLDGCFLRYDNYNFYSESTDPLRDFVNCSSEHGIVGDEAEKIGFLKSVGLAVENVTRVALEKGGFGVGEVEGVYALAQCWKTLGVDGCRKCLKKAGKKVRECVPKREGRGLNAGCYLRYSTQKFYNVEGEIENHNGSSSHRVAVTAIVLAGVAILVLCFSAFYAVFSTLSKMKDWSNQGQILTTINKSRASFKYETLEKATDYFNPSRKIGQGGAGCVFKGTLPNGKVVAVKRLVFNTRQWVDEFFNEVNLISGIQHKNLVKLLGCSVEGPESLLVYEYVQNRSLDQFLFEKNKNHILNWKQRFDIIKGTAEGLAYLHGGNKVRIIHRDIKSSNVLLDENLAPKIADFGLARCFAADKTHLSTGIAGTLGYMAPEYIIRGQLTEKADVYSFGVLVLETVCGRRNNAFIEDSRDALLQTVWKLYRLNRLSETVDPSLGDKFHLTEALNVLQIGLLCTQASVSSRPYMPEVVSMLNKDLGIPVPNQPPFLNPRVLESVSSIRSYSTDSSISHGLKRIEVSSTTPTESSSGTPTSCVPSIQNIDV